MVVSRGFVYSSSSGAWRPCEVAPDPDPDSKGVFVRYKNTTADGREEKYEKFLTPAMQRKLLRLQDPDPTTACHKNLGGDFIVEQWADADASVATVQRWRSSSCEMELQHVVDPTTNGAGQAPSGSSGRKRSMEGPDTAAVHPVVVDPKDFTFSDVPVVRATVVAPGGSSTSSGRLDAGAGHSAPASGRPLSNNPKPGGTRVEAQRHSYTTIVPEEEEGEHSATQQRQAITGNGPAASSSSVAMTSGQHGNAGAGSRRVLAAPAPVAAPSPRLQVELQPPDGRIGRLVLAAAFNLGDPTADMLERVRQCANGFQVHGVLYKIRNDLKNYEGKIATIKGRIEGTAPPRPPEQAAISPIGQPPNTAASLFKLPGSTVSLSKTPSTAAALGVGAFRRAVSSDKITQNKSASKAATMHQQALTPDDVKAVIRDANCTLWQMASLKHRLETCRQQIAARFPNNYPTLLAQEVDALQSALDYNLERCKACKLSVAAQGLAILPKKVVSTMTSECGPGENFLLQHPGNNSSSSSASLSPLTPATLSGIRDLTIHLCPNPSSNFPIFVPEANIEARGKRSSFEVFFQSKETPVAFLRQETLLNARDVPVYRLFSGIDEDQKYPYHCKFLTTTNGEGEAHSVLIVAFDYLELAGGSEITTGKFGEAYNMFGETVAELIAETPKLVRCKVAQDKAHYDAGLLLLAAVLIAGAMPKNRGHA